MIKCLECGFETGRLQWTHFKYKCTGRAKSLSEYKKLHPNAATVSPEVAYKTRVSEDTLIQKYGPTEGKQRWIEYKKKQARSNTFEYKKEKYGWTKEQFDEYNLSRACTLENLINRHGEVQGAILWQEYCERQAFTNTLDYFKNKYGSEEGVQKYREVCSKKAHTVDNVMRLHGCSLDEAVKILTDRSSRLQYTSEVEKTFVSLIEKELCCSISYSIKTKQFCVYGNGKANFYDIVHNKRAIEFHGDYWHCNPKMYDANFVHPHIQMLAEDKWEADRRKIELLKEKTNIDTLVVWESEFAKDPENTVRRCAEWIRNGKR